MFESFGEGRALGLALLAIALLAFRVLDRFFTREGDTHVGSDDQL